MEVNVVKIWMKNKMKKGVKINLLLKGYYWIFRHDSEVIFAGWFERLLDGFSPGFWVEYWSSSLENEDSAYTKFACIE